MSELSVSVGDIRSTVSSAATDVRSHSFAPAKLLECHLACLMEVVWVPRPIRCPQHRSLFSVFVVSSVLYPNGGRLAIDSEDAVT